MPASSESAGNSPRPLDSTWSERLLPLRSFRALYSNIVVTTRRENIYRRGGGGGDRDVAAAVGEGDNGASIVISIGIASTATAIATATDSTSSVTRKLRKITLERVLRRRGPRLLLLLRLLDALHYHESTSESLRFADTFPTQYF